MGGDGGLFDKLNDGLLVDNDVGAQSPFIGFVLNVVTFQDAVGLEHLAVHVAEEREGKANLLGERRVGGGTIQTNSENFRIRGVNFTGGDSTLDRRNLLACTPREAQTESPATTSFLTALC